MSLLVHAVVPLLLLAARTAFGDPALPCDESLCLLPKCRCSTTSIPAALHRNDTPQFVLFTFDDAVNVLNFEYYRKAFEGRSNRDKCPAAATFFVSHDYTNYQLVPLRPPPFDFSNINNVLGRFQAPSLVRSGPRDRPSFRFASRVHGLLEANSGRRLETGIRQRAPDDRAFFENTWRINQRPSPAVSANVRR